MKYFATLIVGKTYDVSGCKFTTDAEKQVDKKLYDYLKDNPQFKVREEKPAQPKKTAPAKKSSSKSEE